MLLANRAVAKFIFMSQNEDVRKKGSQSVYRIHGKPDKERIQNLAVFLKALGFELKNKDGEVTSQDINALLKEVEGTKNEDLIKTATIRSMAKAVYSTKNIGHFGLAFTYYTHFTSPIRRYPDLMVHRFLERELNGDTLAAGKGNGVDDARAFALFVLAEAGKADRGRMVALFEKRSDLQTYGRAYLLMGLKDVGGEDIRIRTLIGELMSSATLTTTEAHWEEQRPDYWTMSSNTRTTALALQALVRADRQNFLIPNATRYLMGLRDHGHWQTTQETAISAIALAEYVASSGELAANYRYTIALDNKQLSEGQVNKDNLSNPITVAIALADLGAGGQSQISMQKQGDGRLYYTLRLRTYADAATVQPLDRGYVVSREYVAVASDTLTPTGRLVTGAKLGEVVQVRLTLQVPEDAVYLAVEDMLPAGLEPLDASLKTVSSAAQEPELNQKGEYPGWWYFTRTTIRDNRVALFATDLPSGTYTYTYLARATTPGVFQTLPALAYQMYAPEVYGRSAGAIFTVTVP